MKRRDFIKLAAGSMMTPAFLRAGYPTRNWFGVHPFVQSHPDAVFIFRTDVDSKHNRDAKKTAGRKFAGSVFRTEGGDFAPDAPVALKPNLTSRGQWMAEYTVERSMGVVTDVDFMEGLIEGMKTGLAKPGRDFFIREVNGDDNLTDGGYAEMAQRTGCDIAVRKASVDTLPPEQVVWKPAPRGVWFKNIPYLWPINAPDSFLLNISKIKAHGMGMTLCAKNLQGGIAAPYQQHCTAFNRDMAIDNADIQPNARQIILENYNRHKPVIPRWDRPGQDGGIWQETWATRCLDNNSVTQPALHIIEAIYGHDGNFVRGPHDGLARDFMMNFIIFGKNPFHVDTIGTWLAGHEPGNFGLFHLALERGQSSILNPHEIPLYEWSADGAAVTVDLDVFPRTPLKTYYLQRDYDGQAEPYWHLVDEPFDYSTVGVARESAAPQYFHLGSGYPNPFNHSTSVEFRLPRAGHVRLEIFNLTGQRVEILRDRILGAGTHAATWRAAAAPGGVYILRCSFEGRSQIRRLVLTK